MLYTCPSCSHKVARDAKFCPKCGKPDAGENSIEATTGTLAAFAFFFLLAMIKRAYEFLAGLFS